ncbi:MAG: serine hydrolase [Bryobacteraceae bacterium]|nr:serine hydrolase [Bryobacteraceae bacterium]
MQKYALLSLVLAGGAWLRADPLIDRIKERVGTFSGTVSLYAKNLDSGATLGIADNDPVRTASTIKLPIMLAVFRAVEDGKAKWTETLSVTKAEKVSGSGIIASEISDGVSLPLRDVVNLMIVLSDNTATNMLIERFTAEAVNSHLDQLGIKGTRLMRKILGDGTSLKSPSGWSAVGKLPENAKYGTGKSTPKDMVTILEKLEKGEIISPEASKEMLAILKRCQDNKGIRRKLNGYTIASKSGALDALRSDVAVVYTKQGTRIAMAITVEGIPSIDYTPENPGLLMIADLAQIIVEGMSGK